MENKEFEKISIRIDSDSGTLKAYAESGKELACVQSIEIEGKCGDPAFVRMIFALDAELNPMIQP